MELEAFAERNLKLRGLDDLMRKEKPRIDANKDHKKHKTSNGELLRRFRLRQKCTVVVVAEKNASITRDLVPSSGPVVDSCKQISDKNVLLLL